MGKAKTGVGVDVAGLATIDLSARVLMDVSIGRISIMEGARQLELQEAGHLLHRLAEAGLPLPRLSKKLIDRQLAQAKEALDACRVEPIPVGKKSGKATSKRTSSE
ncbi:MAG: hypothetical protein H7346_08565 [Burkholderiaceae bacterium]|nr:hypothetical protein [Burkholderiaceae bacterium]